MSPVQPTTEQVPSAPRGPSLPELIPIGRSRDFLGWSRGMSYRFHAEGLLEVVKVGRAAFVTRVSAEKLIAELPRLRSSRPASAPAAA
jgi:hypothetical protein